VFFEADAQATADRARRQAWAAEARTAWAAQAAARDEQPLSIGRRPDTLLPPPPPRSHGSGSSAAAGSEGEFAWLAGLRAGQDQDAASRKEATQSCLAEHAQAFRDAQAQRYGGRVARAGGAAAAAAADGSDASAAARGGHVLDLAAVRARVAGAGRADLLTHLEAPQRVNERQLGLLLQWQPYQPARDLLLPRFGGIQTRAQASHLAQLLVLVHGTAHPGGASRFRDEHHAAPLHLLADQRPLAGLQSARTLRW
jgi:hypothetical protein